MMNFLILIVYLLFSEAQTQCCVRFVNDQCLQCPHGTHLYKNSCINDIKHCLQYQNGFECVKCQIGFTPNTEANKCMMSQIKDGELPKTGFKQVSAVQFGSQIYAEMIMRAQEQFVELGNMEILVAYERIVGSQSFYKLVMSTGQGLASILFGQRNPTNSIQIQSSKIFTKNSNQQFGLINNDPYLKDLLQTLNSNNLKLIDFFKSQSLNTQNQTLQLNYRLFFQSESEGIAEVNITIEMDEKNNDEFINEIKIIDVDRKSMNDSLREAIQMLESQQFINKSVTLINLTQNIRQSNQNIQSISYNASFLEDQTHCIWIQFKFFGTPLQLAKIQSGKCIAENAQNQTSCKIEARNFPQHIVFTKYLNFDEFLMSKQFTQIRKYILQCQQLIFQILSLAIAQTPSTIFYQLRFQIFRTKQLLFLTAFKQKGQPLKISSIYRIPNSQLTTTKLIINQQSGNTKINRRQLSLGNDKLVQESLAYLRVQYPQIQGYDLVQIQRYGIQSSNHSVISCSFAYPRNRSYEGKEFVYFRAQRNSQGFISLPKIQRQRQIFKQIPLQNIGNLFLDAIVEISKFQLISADNKLNETSIKLRNFFQSQTRTNIYLFYYQIQLQVAVYLFSSVTGQMSKVLRLKHGYYDLTPQQILEDPHYMDITQFIGVIFKKQMESKLLKLDGLKLQTKNNGNNVELMFVYKKGQQYMNVSARDNDGGEFRIVNVSVNIERGYEEIGLNQMKIEHLREYQKYGSMINITKIPMKPAIQHVYKSKQSFKIVDDYKFQITIPITNKSESGSGSGKLMQMENILKMSQTDPADRFNKQIDSITSRYGLPSKTKNTLILSQQYGTSTGIFRYTYKIASNLQTYYLTFQSTNNSPPLTLLSLQHLKLQEWPSSYSETEPQIKLSQLLNKIYQTTALQILKCYANKELFKIVIKSQSEGILEVYFKRGLGLFEFYGVRSVYGGYQRFGFDQISLIRERKEFIIDSDFVQKDFIKIAKLVNIQKIQNLSRSKLILWQLKRINTHQLLQLYYQLQISSQVVTLTYLILPNLKSNLLIDFQTLSNNMQTLHKQQSQLIRNETIQVLSDPLFTRIEESIRKSYWYYLRECELVSAFKLVGDTGVMFVVNYQTMIRTVQITVQYTFKTQNIQVLSLVPSMYDEEEHEEIYRCSRYSTSDDSCSSCHQGYMLTRGGYCFPILKDCWVQSGDQCILKSP